MTSSRFVLLFAVSLAAVLVACGGDDDAPGTDGGPGIDGGPGPVDGGPTPDDGGPILADGGPTSEDGGPAPEDGGAADDAGTAAEVTLSGVAVYANCMPIVAPDPIIAFWNASVTGASGDTATLVDAKLTVTSGGTTVMQTLTVDTPTIALTSGAGSQDQRKSSGDPTPEGACGTLCSDSDTPYTLELTFMIDGAPVVVTDMGGFSCVY